jgi:hypothetical protein
MRSIKYAVFAVFLLSGLTGKSQEVKNTSYINNSGERVLRLEIILPLNVNGAWKLFTNDENLKKWIAPLAHIELKSGGYIVTNYDAAKNLTDSSSIRLPVMSFIDNELIVFKVNLNNNFPLSARKSDTHLQEIIQFKKVRKDRTQITSSMVGWGTGNDWDKTYDFFARGNEFLFNKLIKNYK